MDMDEVFERVLVDAGSRKLVFSVGKTGILWKLDRATGEFLGYKETVYQNIFDRIDPKTGGPAIGRISPRRRLAIGSRAARARPAATTGRP